MSDSKKKLEEINKLLERSLDLSEDVKEGFRQSAEGLSKMENNAKGFKNLQDNILDATIKQNSSFNDINQTLKAISGELSKQEKDQGQLIKGLKGMTAQANKLANEESNISSYNKKQLLSMQEKIGIEKKRAKEVANGILAEIGFTGKKGQTFAAVQKKINKMRAEGNKKEADAAQTALGIIKDKGAAFDALEDKLKERIALEDKFTDTLGFGVKAAQGLDKALQKAGLPSLGIANAIDEAKKNFVDTNGESSIFLDITKNIGKNLLEAVSFANIMQLSFGALIKSVLEVDKASGEFAKNQGISYSRTLEIREEMSKVAQSSDDILVSSKSLMKTQSRLNELMGSNVVFSGELASDMDSIARRTGMSAETQELFTFESLKSGKSAKDLLATQQLTTLQQNKQRGLTMSMKQVQDAIGKSSKSLQLTFKNSTKELTNQVMAAKALGTNLAGVESIASSLLDFESSIQAELEAELLLGKDINLEKARSAALEGDMAKVADEVLKNKAIMNAFDTKNVIAQEAAAKALGMNREGLASMIKEQQQLEAIKDSGFKNMDDAQTKYNAMLDSGMSKEEAASKIKDKDLLTQLESASLSEKFGATMERVQEIFVEMAVPILEMVQGLMSADGFASKLAKTVKAIAITYGAIKLAILGANIAKGIGLLMTKKETKEEKKKALAKIGGVTAAFVTNPIGAAVGLALGVAAAAGMYAALKDGVIDPKKGPVISGEFGTVQIDPNDQIAVGTDLMGEKKPKGNGGENNAALLSGIQALISVNQKILAKSTTLEVDKQILAETTTNQQVKVDRLLQ